MARPLTQKEKDSITEFTPIQTTVEGGFNKKVENFWYYYRNYVFFISFAVIFIAVVVGSILFQSKPDLTVCLAGSYTWIEDDTIADLEDVLSSQMDDVNGDNRIIVDVVRGYMVSDTIPDGTDPEVLSAYQEQFLTGLSTGSFFVIIADPYIASVIEHDDLYQNLNTIIKTLPPSVCGVDIADTELLKNAPELAERLKGFRFIPRKWTENDMETHSSTKDEVYCAKIFLKKALKPVTTITPFEPVEVTN